MISVEQVTEFARKIQEAKRPQDALGQQRLYVASKYSEEEPYELEPDEDLGDNEYDILDGEIESSPLASYHQGPGWFLWVDPESDVIGKEEVDAEIARLEGINTPSYDEAYSIELIVNGQVEDSDEDIMRAHRAQDAAQDMWDNFDPEWYLEGEGGDPDELEFYVVIKDAYGHEVGRIGSP